MSEGGQDLFTIDYHPDVRIRWRRWGELAARVGMLDEFIDAVRTVEWRLRHEALEWGEPFRHLRGLNMIQRKAVQWFFLVTYGVNEQARYVYIERVDLLPNNPFENT
jgi:hypothetical protein